MPWPVGRILRAMLLPSDRAWQLPWLRLHLFMRDVLAVPWGKDWPIVKRGACAVRRAAARDDSGRVVQLNVRYLIVIAREIDAFQGVVHEELGRNGEILLDRRRAERRRAASTTPEERRRGDR